MHQRLHLRLIQLERATEQLLQAAEALGERAHQAPGPGQWSAAQVVQHLLVAETGISHYIDKKVHVAADMGIASYGHFLRSRLLRLLLRAPFLRFRVPAPLAAATPAAVPPLLHLRAEWAAVRRRLERTLDEYPPALLNRAIFRHPRSGMLTLPQTLDFLLDHVLHHQKQVARIANAVTE